MLFNSIDFIIFFPIIVLGYFILPVRVRNIWLLLASYYFYMCWNATYAVLIFFSTLVTYCCGIVIQKLDDREDKEKAAIYKKITVIASLIINLGILFFFKYFNFSLDVLSSILSVINIDYVPNRVDVLLPVGISFYTFQALGYTIDVYRGDIVAENNFLKYALFVSFFPQLVAGPIERSGNLLGQLSRKNVFDFDRVLDGFMIMLWGYFLKLVLADRVAIFVDSVYGDMGTYCGAYLIVASLLFAVQIYCDFAGYSTIAVGAAKILGIELMENFNAPYLAVSVAEFWRNWHISLTSWFKDYVYIPLGGSRCGKSRKYLNKMIVFLLSGLWHGANFTYVVWGGLNGAYQVLGESLTPIRNKLVSKLGLNRYSLGHKIISSVTTFVLVDFTWIFFRASTCSEAIAIIKSIVADRNTWVLFDGSLYECGLNRQNFMVIIVGIMLLLMVDICKRRGIVVRDLVATQDAWFRSLTVIIAIVVILTFGIWGPSYSANNFIYFQF